jgi:hypothetical protein
MGVGSMTDKAAQRFEQTVKERLTQATNETGYSFAGIYKIIKDKGAVVAAKILISPINTGKVHDGLKVLVDRNLYHLSIEQAVIDFENEGLFSEDEISSAQGRLALARMKSGKTNISERLKRSD